jgi:hypothetical protein
MCRRGIGGNLGTGNGDVGRLRSVERHDAANNQREIHNEKLIMCTLQLIL